jgi:hypothetical protein
MTKAEIRLYLERITRQNILSAFIVLDKDERITQTLIRQFVILHEYKNYPPPETIRIAYEKATGDKLPKEFFANIGLRSEHFKFIRELGFEIAKKENLNMDNGMKNRTVVFKLVPQNEVQSGTEIGILKHYMNIGLIQDPQTSKKHIVTDQSARFYPIKFIYNTVEYDYQIKAYPTSNWSKDRRLIINTSDPIFRDRNEGDFLCFCFNGKIDAGSTVISNVIKNDSPLHDIISKNYQSKKGYVLNDPVNKDLIDQIFEITNETKEKKDSMHLNQILFGPPGTGKTDSTVEKALEILEMSSQEPEEKKRREENRETFRSLLNKKIFFVTMHPSYSYEDFVQGIKPKTSASGDLLFELKPGIFKRVAESCIPYFMEPYFPGFLMSIYEDEIRQIEGSNLNQQQLLDLIGSKCGVSGGTIKNYRDYFDNVLGSLSPRVGYSDDNFTRNKIDKKFYQDLAKVYLEIPKDMLFSSFQNNWLITSKIKKYEGTKNHRVVLILDEINRANISKVFGELITLLEEDKRIGKENAMAVTLPSGEVFSVPPNLYVIGTMNTADKSIALVDIALRRRFQFVPIYPQSKVIEDFGTTDKDGKKTLMEVLNKQLINQSGKYYKGVDFQIGHAYFLKDNSLSDVINENIIPLLTEYFRNDLEKVKSMMNEVGNPLDEDYYKLTGMLRYQ